MNDDAAFSPTDLEKVLRAWDADSGALPSRLWDSVDAFDPVKLIRFDPNDTVNFANNLLDPRITALACRPTISRHRPS